MNDTVKQLAASCGANLAPVLEASDVVAFEVLGNGEVEVHLAGGMRTVIVLQMPVEEFVRAMCGDVLPPGHRPDGRRFFRRNVITGKSMHGIRFSEAGRDV